MTTKSAVSSALILVVAAFAIGGLWSALLPAVQETPVPAVRDSGQKTAKQTAANQGTAQELFSGKVVILQDALKQRGVKSDDEFKSQVVLETDDGELIPIVPDWRGRAFFQDKRLRDRRVDLIGTRKNAPPYLQVLMIFVFDELGTRQYMDYWCDICAIPMYQIQPCDCCQADIRLRLQTQELPDFVRKPAKR